MNRIICDICGSEYPENAERCPICSYARQGTEKIAVSSAEAVRTKVKGGRFSNKNVKKRLRAQEKAAAGEENSNRGLWITVVLLLVAIALVTGYIVMRFLVGQGAFTGAAPAQSTAPATSDPATQPPAVPCESLAVGEAVLELDAPGAQKQLSVKALPGDTTDAVLYASADPSVATVSDTGLVTAVGSGQTAGQHHGNDAVISCLFVEPHKLGTACVCGKITFRGVDVHFKFIHRDISPRTIT